MAYATYEFYTSSFRGNLIPQADFDRLAERASELIDFYTFGKAESYKKDDKVKNCCCALAEAIESEEKSQGKNSETVGSWSVSYSGKREADSRKRSIINQYLWLTGLMYAGMGC